MSGIKEYRVVNEEWDKKTNNTQKEYKALTIRMIFYSNEE
tara:strand:- start:72 stop:191 length:120 start_codon:yes stop_codon:yes gene_type:complete